MQDDAIDAVRPSYETYGRNKGIKKSSIEYNEILALDYIICI